MTRRILVLTTDPVTRSSVEEALAAHQVEAVDPTRRSGQGQRVVGDVAVVDPEAAGEGELTTERFVAKRIIHLTADRDPPDSLCVEKPVDPEELRDAVDRAFRRLTYLKGLDAYAAAATRKQAGRPDVGQASLGESLQELVAEFDHADFTAAFRDAVVGH